VPSIESYARETELWFVGFNKRLENSADGILVQVLVEVEARKYFADGAGSHGFSAFHEDQRRGQLQNLIDGMGDIHNRNVEFIA